MDAAAHGNTWVNRNGDNPLSSETVPVTLVFAQPVANVTDERTGKSLGSGKEFPLQWKMNEACVLSFER